MASLRFCTCVFCVVLRANSRRRRSKSMAEMSYGFRSRICPATVGLMLSPTTSCSARMIWEMSALSRSC